MTIINTSVLDAGAVHVPAEAIRHALTSDRLSALGSNVRGQLEIALAALESAPDGATATVILRVEGMV